MTIVDEKKRGYALGASEYLVKPADRDRLAAVLHRICGKEGTHVLVVDDDEFAREGLRRSLARDGWQVSTADNGLTALECMRAGRQDVIILDLMMPEMDGFEFLDELRRDPAWRAVPVVVITAKDLTDDDHRRLNGGVASIITKSGVSTDALLREICIALDACVNPAHKTESSTR
jgi:CheY-like chemotaxis protein